MKKKIALGLLAVFAALILVAYNAHQAFARPEYSSNPNNCTPCHTDGRTASGTKPAPKPAPAPSGTKATTTKKSPHKGYYLYNHQLEVLKNGNASCSKCHSVDFCVSCHINMAKPVTWDTKHYKLNSKTVNVHQIPCVTCHKDFKKKKP